VKFDLLFFRFINPERDDFPDIDLDFEDKRRDEAKAYLRKRWGEENVAGISAYGTFKAKGSVKGISSVFGVPYTEANKATSLFEDLDEYRNSDKLSEFRRKYPEIERIAARLDGRYRTASAHAAGIVVSSVPIRDIAPIEMRTEAVTKNKIAVVAYDKDECGEMGLIKLDALSVRAITVVKDCINKVKERYGLDVKAESLDIDNPDPRVFEEFSAGNVVGIFQAEGAGYANLIQSMGIKNFKDLVASNALVRPGSYVTQGETYLAVRDGTQKARYHHEILEQILGETYGTYIFEEQVMKIAVELAGFTWAKADRLRKIISKKKDESAFDDYKIEFISGASRYITENQAQKLWADIEKASLYMFNKSHATAYSLVSYQTMWLKVNYPLEFLWATLTNEIEAEKTTTYLFEAQRLGIPILPPDVNTSDITFTLTYEGLRFGILNIAGCGESAAKDIIDKRPFDSYEDFVERTNSRSVKKNVVESMDKVGFFESLGWSSQYEKERYFGPILSYPINLNNASPFDEIIAPCTEANTGKENTDLFVIRGVVKSAKRTQRYFRVEIEDSDGVCSSFADKEKADLSKRDYVIALVGDQTIHHYADFFDVESGEDQSGFGKFLRNQIDPSFNMTPYDHFLDHGCTYGIVGDRKTITVAYLLSFVEFETKSGVKMGSCYFWNPDQGNFKTTVFADLVDSSKSRYLEPFNWVVIKTNQNPRRKETSLHDIISCEQFAKNKDIINLNG
jgi:DNA polymerase-3 subunit alpha